MVWSKMGAGGMWETWCGTERTPLRLGDFVTKVAALYTFPIYVPCDFFYILKLEWKLMSGQ